MEQEMQLFEFNTKAASDALSNNVSSINQLIDDVDQRVWLMLY